MPYSLLSRFQGTLLGAVLGDDLGDWQHQKRAQTQDDLAALGQHEWLGAPVDLAYWHPGAEPISRSWHDRAIASASTLIASGGQKRLRGTMSLPFMALDRSVKDRSAGANNTAGLTAAEPCRSSSALNELLTTVELAIATLPVTLFFHDNETMLQETLQQTLQSWQGNADSDAGVLAVGYAIAQILKERFDPSNLIPQIIAYLRRYTDNLTADTVAFISQLEQVQRLVQQRAGLQAAIAALRTATGESRDADDRAIALAFYCFLSTPDDPRLAMLRAVRCSDSSAAITALTGALSGANNSLIGLPLTWRITAQPSQVLQGDLSGTACQLAAQLYTAWSGVYDPTGAIDTLSAIAAPGVIRPR